MKFGFIANIFAWNGVKEIERVVDFAATAGYAALELGPTYPLTDQTINTIRDGGLEISNLIYCRNLLTPDSAEADRHAAAIAERIDFAADHAIPVVGLCGGYAFPHADFSAADSYGSVRALPLRNLEPFLAAYGPLVERAARAGVRIAFENCPLMGNWLIAPPLWQEAFDRLDNPYAGLAFDPSHLIWLFIDPYLAYAEFAERVFHIHAKDTEIIDDRLKRRGILTDFSWWENRLPGYGELNWLRFLELVRTSGFSGTVSVEHEDPDWSGSVDKVERSLTQALRFLRHAAESSRPQSGASGEERVVRSD